MNGLPSLDLFHLRCWLVSLGVLEAGNLGTIAIPSTTFGNPTAAVFFSTKALEILPANHIRKNAGIAHTAFYRHNDGVVFEEFQNPICGLQIGINTVLHRSNHHQLDEESAAQYMFPSRSTSFDIVGCEFISRMREFRYIILLGIKESCHEAGDPI